MSNTLLVDFGASRLKVAICSLQKGKILDSAECDAPKPQVGPNGEMEVAPEDYWNCLSNTAGILLDKYPETYQMWICAEMHGVLLLDANSLTPLTPYISWRDERASKKYGVEPSTYSQFINNDFRDLFFSETGQNLRMGLPYLTLAHLFRSGSIKSKAIKVCTLVDWILIRGGEKSPKIHASLAAGTGLYSIDRGDWSDQLLDSPSINLVKNQFSRLARSGEKIGNISLKGYLLSVYGGLGDLQAAIHGAGLPKKGRLLVNLGTGSQVIGVTAAPISGVERRPGSQGDVFSAITHIPSGRGLNVFAQFIDQCSSLGGGDAIFWKIFNELDVDEIINSKLTIDLNVFEASWRYLDGGSITQINESNFTPRKFIAGLVKAWLTQYVNAMDLIDSIGQIENFLVSGGLSRRGLFVLPVLERLSNRKGTLVATTTGEETLDGLLELALENNAN